MDSSKSGATCDERNNVFRMQIANYKLDGIEAVKIRFYDMVVQTDHILLEEQTSPSEENVIPTNGSIKYTETATVMCHGN